MIDTLVREKIAARLSATAPAIPVGDLQPPRPSRATGRRGAIR